MTIYQGSLAAGGDAASSHTVTVDHENGEGERLLAHRVRHSPTGFSWGYQGSGPADLARSILWEHLGEEPHPACYQAFKRAFVARWPEDDGWTLSSAEIDEWLAEWALEHSIEETTVERDIAEPQPGTETVSGAAVCHHCGQKIFRSSGEHAYLHEGTQVAHCEGCRPGEAPARRSVGGSS